MTESNRQRTKIKICGIQTVDSAIAVGRLQPDLIGFVFAPSRRQVTPEWAGRMIHALQQSDSRALAAGVFVNPDMAELEAVMEKAPIAVIQLHGQETPEFCSSVKARFSGVSVYKVVSLAADADVTGQGVAELIADYQGAIDAIMLDTQGGGTGRTFNWSLIPKCAAVAANIGIPLFIAGGLHPDNVGELVMNYRPDGVDVSSGVETDGQKDLNKIRLFMERVDSIDQQRT